MSHATGCWAGQTSGSIEKSTRSIPSWPCRRRAASPASMIYVRSTGHRCGRRRCRQGALRGPLHAGRGARMLSKRIIPCLDVRDGQVVKGVQFRDHEMVGDIVELARRYRDEGADELVFYDITASSDQPHGRPPLDRACRACPRHSLLRRRRHPYGRGRPSASSMAAPTRSPSTPLRWRTQISSRPGRCVRFASAWCVGIDSRARRRLVRLPVHRRSRRRRAPRAAARSTGCKRRPSGAPARSCSTA